MWLVLWACLSALKLLYFFLGVPEAEELSQGQGPARLHNWIQVETNKTRFYSPSFESLLYSKKTNRPKPNQSRKPLKHSHDGDGIKVPRTSRNQNNKTMSYSDLA